MHTVLLLSMTLAAAPTDYDKQLATELAEAREELLSKGQCHTRVSHDCDKARFLIRRSTYAVGAQVFDKKGRRIGATDSACVTDRSKGRIPRCPHARGELETNLCDVAARQLELVAVTIIEGNRTRRIDKSGDELRTGAFTGRVLFSADPLEPVHLVVTEVAAGKSVTLVQMDEQEFPAHRDVDVTLPVGFNVNGANFELLQLRRHLVAR